MVLLETTSTSQRKMLAKSLILLCIATFFVTDAQPLTWANPSGGSGTLTLAEDKATSATVGTYTVTGGTTPITYSLVDGEPPFQILDSTSGALSLSTALDFEKAATHTVKIQAVDSTTSTALTSTAIIVVTVTDVNEAPVFTPSSYSRCLTDGTVAGTSVITVTAADADTGDTISYTITDGNTGTSFDIPTASSGLIEVKSGVSLSTTTASYDLEITASDSGSPVKTATVTVSITVAATCNNAQTLTWTNPNTGTGTLTLAEDQAISTTVGTYTVSGGTGVIKYSVVAGNPPFQVDSSTGALSLSTALDYETAASHTVKLKAVDSTAGTALSSTATITVTVTDVTNENAPVFSLSSYSKCLTDGTAAGTSVITVIAADADTGDTISYTITGGNIDNSFDIPTASSGLIQVSTGVTLSTTTASYDLVITATDSATTAKSATVTVSITVADACNSGTSTIVSMLLLPLVVSVTLF